MPHRFRQKPSSRRAASPVAKWLVTGPSVATEIKYGRQTTYLLPVKASHHRRRYHEGQRLSLKAFVGGPTEAHVHILSADRIPVGDVDFHTARELTNPATNHGFVRLDDFRVAWVAEHEPTWVAEHDSEEVLERFDRRHAHREVWVLRFALDRMLPDRYLAQRSEEGYTESAARGLKDEPPALHDHEWKDHVGANLERTHEEWLALARDRARKPQRLPKHLRKAA